MLLLICSFRSEYTDTSPCLRELVSAFKADSSLDQRELAVEPLEFAEAHTLAAELLKDGAGESGQAGVVADSVQWAETIARESGGNPFFVHELVQHVRSGATIVSTGSAFDPVRLDEVLCRRVQLLPARPVVVGTRCGRGHAAQTGRRI